MLEAIVFFLTDLFLIFSIKFCLSLLLVFLDDFFPIFQAVYILIMFVFSTDYFSGSLYFVFST